MTLPYWSRHPLDSLAAWLSVVVALAVGGAILGLTTVLPGPSSRKALSLNEGERAAKAAGIEARDLVFVVLSHPTLSTSDKQYGDTIESLWRSLKKLPPPETGRKIFEKILTAGHSWLDENLFISADKRHILLIGEASWPLSSSAVELAEIPHSLKGSEVMHRSVFL